MPISDSACPDQLLVEKTYLQNEMVKKTKHFDNNIINFINWKNTKWKSIIWVAFVCLVGIFLENALILCNHNFKENRFITSRSSDSITDPIDNAIDKVSPTQVFV